MAIEGSALDFNDEFRRALGLMEDTRKNVFVTGKAGTGKSTLLTHFRKNTSKNVAVLAPTGVAAVNVEGQTIHSFFMFRPDITADTVKKVGGVKGEIYRQIDAIVVDEVSMVRADLLDYMDSFLRLNGRKPGEPFGGVQMIFFGDLYQLSPVVKGEERQIFRSRYEGEYFFDSDAFRGLEIEMAELEKVYRQKDAGFIRLLNAIRNKSATQDDLDSLNARVDEGFKPPQGEFYISLTTTNDLAAQINEGELGKIKTKPFAFKGAVKGGFDTSHLPTEIDLKVKEGSQVMLVNNDSLHRWVNGTVGKIAGIGDDRGGEAVLLVELANGDTFEVRPHTWKLSKLTYNRESKKLDPETIGTFRQYPLKLAWAVTIHKSQGKTFDNVIIDIGRGSFAHGQTYVALSRCTSFEGIVLRRPLQMHHVIMDWRIPKFLTGFQYGASDKKMSLEEKTRRLKEAAESGSKLEITYLKASDVKSRRTIQPRTVGEMEYQGKGFLGVEAYCFERGDGRVFRIDRILDMKAVQ